MLVHADGDTTQHASNERQRMSAYQSLSPLDNPYCLPILLSIMRQYLAPLGLTLLSILVMAYAILVERLVLFALVTVSILIMSYGLLRRGETEQALVVGLLGCLLAAAFWTARMELQLLAGIVVLLAYLG